MFVVCNVLCEYSNNDALALCPWHEASTQCVGGLVLCPLANGPMQLLISNCINTGRAVDFCIPKALGWP